MKAAPARSATEAQPSVPPVQDMKVALFGGVVLGTLFGFFLERTKVFLPMSIRGQMRALVQLVSGGTISWSGTGETSWLMFKVFLAATAFSALLIAVMEHGFFGLHEPKHRHPARKIALGLGIMGGYGANIVGGVILGVGVTMGGACPGTGAAQLGAGVWSAPLVIAGSLAGAFAFAAFHKAITSRAPGFHAKGEAHFADKVAGFPLGLVAVALAAAMGVLLYIIEVKVPWKRDVQPYIRASAPANATWHPVLGGTLIGLLQLPAIIILQHNLAASGSFVTAAGSIYRMVSGDSEFERLPYFRSFFGFGDMGQVGTVIGIVIGSFWSSTQSGVSYAVDSSVSPLVYFVGGFLMLFGARIAGGCASGHGISGLGRLSTASAATVGGMFGGGMLAAVLM